MDSRLRGNDGDAYAARLAAMAMRLKGRAEKLSVSEAYTRQFARCSAAVVPAQAGTHTERTVVRSMDSRLRGNDGDAYAARLAAMAMRLKGQAEKLSVSEAYTRQFRQM